MIRMGGLSNIHKQYVRRILLDCIMIPSAFYLALLVQNYGDCSPELLVLLTTYIVPLTIVHIFINAMSGIYSQLWAYADLRAAWSIFRASVISTLLLWAGNSIFALFPGLDNGLIIVAGLFNALLSTGFKYRRFLFPASIQEFFNPFLFTKQETDEERALIIGTNSNARRISSQLSRHNAQPRIEILGYIDDDPGKIGMAVNGLKVLGVTAQITELVRSYAIDILIIAVEDKDPEAVWQLISICQETPAQIKVFPGVVNMMDQQYQHPLTLRELRIEDLLHRRPIQVDADLCQDLLQDNVILVTGAAGSIGSELRYQCSYWWPTLRIASR
jgi:FlaA1/EpsC-like NDP-sugar epimerase